MAIPSPINTSYPTVGTTISALAKTGTLEYAVGSGASLKHLVMSKADPTKTRSGIRLVYKTNPGLGEAESAAPNGKISVVVQPNFTLGTTVTATFVRNFIKELASVLSQDAVIDALVAGSDQ